MPIPNQYSANLMELIAWMLKKNQDQRPTVSEILRSQFMAGYLLHQGYEPGLIGVAVDSLKMAIEQKSKELLTIRTREPPATNEEVARLEKTRDGLERSLEKNLSLAPLKYDPQPAQTVPSHWVAAWNEEQTEYHAGCVGANDKYTGPGVHIWTDGVILVYEG